MSFSNPQLTKNMSSQLFYDITNPQKNKIMSFSNTQLTKNMSSQLFYDIINPQKIIEICHFQIRN